MRRAEVTSLPLTIGILIVAFGALVAAGLPVLLAFSAVLAATGLNSLVSHLVPTDQQTLSAIILMIGMAVGIDYSLFYLRRAREERYARPLAARCAAARGAHLRAGGAHLGRDRADRDGRHVRLGQLALHHDRARHDDRRPGRDGRLADRPAGRPAPAGRQGRQGPHPALPRTAARRRAVGPLHRRRPAPAVDGAARRRAARCSSSPCPAVEHAHEAPEPHRPSARPEDRADVRPDPAGVPGLADAGGGRGQGSERRHAADAARLRPLQAARARHGRAVRAVHRAA